MGTRIKDRDEAMRELERVRDAMTRVDEVLERLSEQRAKYAAEMTALHEALVSDGGAEVL